MPSVAPFNRCHSARFFKGQRPKTGTHSTLGAKNRYKLKSNKKRTPLALPLVDNALLPFSQDKAQAHPSLSALLDFQLLIFLSFCSRSEILHSSTLCPYTNVDARGDPFHPPQPTPRHTSNARTCLVRGSRKNFLSRSIDRAYLDFRCGRRLPSVAMVQLGIRMPYLCISAEACRQ